MAEWTGNQRLQVIRSVRLPAKPPPLSLPITSSSPSFGTCGSLSVAHCGRKAKASSSYWGHWITHRVTKMSSVTPIRPWGHASVAFKPSAVLSRVP